MGYGDNLINSINRAGETAYRGFSDMGDNAREKAALADREFQVNKFLKYDKPVLDQQLAQTQYANEPASIASLAPKGNSERVYFIDNIARDVASLWKGAKLNDDLTITKPDGSLVPRWEMEKMVPQLQSLTIARTDPYKSLELKNYRLMEQLEGVEDPKQRAEIESQIASNMSVLDDPVKMLGVNENAIADLGIRKQKWVAMGGDAGIFDDQIKRLQEKNKGIIGKLDKAEQRRYEAQKFSREEGIRQKNRVDLATHKDSLKAKDDKAKPEYKPGQALKIKAEIQKARLQYQNTGGMSEIMFSFFAKNDPNFAKEIKEKDVSSALKALDDYEAYVDKFIPKNEETDPLGLR